MAREPMTPADERQLLGALEAIADGVNAAESPDEAIAKVAVALDVPPGHLPLLVNAYNIGRTARQRADGVTPAEKAADFAVADLDAIRARLYPPAVKAAARVEAEEGVDPAYTRPPDWYGRPALAPARVKAAAAPSARAPRPITREALLKRAYAECARRDLVVAEARRLAAAAQDRLLATFGKLAAALRAPGEPGLATLRPAVAALHGAAGAAVLDHLARTDPFLAKRAAAGRPHPVSAHPVPYALVAAAVKHAGDLLAMRGLHAGLEALRRCEDAEALAPFRPGPPPPPLLDGLDATPTKAALAFNLADKALGTGVFQGLSAAGRQLAPPDQDRRVERAMEQIATPEHEQQLRAIEAQAMLHELINHDEVLSGHDPYEVARHYNDLSRFAPTLATQPLAAVPALRKAVQQGQLDSFDVKELADTEGKTHERRQPAQAAKKP